MKRIAIVAHGLSSGGAEKVASIISNYLVSRQYDVLFICVYSSLREYHIDPRIRVEDIKVTSGNKFINVIERNIQVFNKLNEFKAEVVISFITREMFYSVMRNVHVIFSLRNDPARADVDRLSSFIRKFDYKRSQKIVFQTPGAKEYFDKSIQKKGVIIENPLLTDELPIWNPSRKVFITACRLDSQKNVPLLVKAFIMFHQNHSDYILEIYGDGPLKRDLQKMIYNNHAERYIFLRGRTTEIYKIMSEATAFVLSSDYEGISNSMLEALCIGIPCICTDCPSGGAKMFIKDDVNGYLVPVGNEDELAHKMERTITMLDNFKENINRIFELRKRVNVNTVCEKWISLLKEE